MKSTNKALLVMVVLFLLGAWGCSQYPGNSPGSGSARVRDLESRNAKLDEDYRLAIANRDQARKQAVALEETQGRLQEELNALTKDRDDLRRQVGQRIGERDTLQTQLIQFGKELQNLAGRIDAAVNLAPLPSGASTTTAVPNRESWFEDDES